MALILWKVRDVARFGERTPGQKLALKIPSGKLRIYLSILLLFILSCSTDAFLILRAQELGVRPVFLPLIWMVLHLVKMSTTLPFGILSDKIGRRRVILAGWIVYTLVYLGFAMASKIWHAWALFIVYGLFYGFTEGSERAILADYAGAAERGQAFGWYYFVVGLVSLPASLLFGFLWQGWGSHTAFFVSACISAAAAFLLFLFLQFVPSAAGTN